MLIKLIALTPAVTNRTMIKNTKPLDTTDHMANMMTRLAPNNCCFILYVLAPKFLRTIARLLVRHVARNVCVAQVKLANSTARLSAVTFWAIRWYSVGVLWAELVHLRELCFDYVSL